MKLRLLLLLLSLQLGSTIVLASSDAEKCSAYNTSMGGKYCFMAKFEDGEEPVCRQYTCGEDGCEDSWAVHHCPWRAYNGKDL